MATGTFKNVTEILSFYPHESYYLDHFEKLRWNGKVISPFDPYSKVYKCKLNRYRCKNTGKYFNVKTGTIFHNSKIEMSIWFAAIWLFTNNPKITSTQLAKELALTQKTSWFIRQKIKHYLKKGDVATDIFKSPELNGLESKFEESKKHNVSKWLQLLKK